MLKLITLCAGVLVATGTSAQDLLLERGSYLLNSVMASDGCHTPGGRGGRAWGGCFWGGPRVGAGRKFLVRGPNTRPDGESGRGGGPPAEGRLLLRGGRRPKGCRAPPKMPYPFNKILPPPARHAI